ncbi:MAG: peptide-methionine (S)-S-oxide reductase [Parcubacteria bacterium C7867-007]|nr:MAG: peptide-methionine (S)-S-oxide reductase [Parcubacteria bacterium C7867-007]
MTETAIFGGGCFWCTEAVFKMLKGVSGVEPGYAGGKSANPTYQQVCGGDTGHAEVIKIEFDPSQVAYRDLLTVFFGSHDATQLNRQGNDVGTQYRSVVFPTTPEQKEETVAFIKELSDSSSEGDPIVTTIEEGATFYPAEEYHKDYYAQNKMQGYCQVIIAPKLQKVQEKYAQLLKEKVV